MRSSMAGTRYSATVVEFHYGEPQIHRGRALAITTGSGEEPRAPGQRRYRTARVPLARDSIGNGGHPPAHLLKREHGSEILVAQHTTSHRDDDHKRGLHLHPAIAIDAVDSALLGMLAADIMAHDETLKVHRAKRSQDENEAAAGWRPRTRPPICCRRVPAA
jgi:hypothetical protein